MSYHPRTEPKVDCLIGSQKELKGHVKFDQTLDVMLPKSMICRPDSNSQ